MKFNRKTKYSLVGFSIIGALAIIAGSTAAVTIHSNSNSTSNQPINKTDSSTKNSTNPSVDENHNNPNNGSLTPNSTSSSSSTNSNPSSSNNPNSKNTNTTNGEPNKNGTGSKSGNGTSNSGSTGTKTGNSGSKNSSKNDGSETNGQNSGSGPVQTNPKNTQPGPSPTNTNENETVAKILDSLLNSSINVANYDSMNTLTPIQALNKPNALIYAIRQAISNEVSPSSFDEVSGNNYNPLEIVSQINVKLPNANSLNSNYSVQIQDVSLSYNGISLNASNGSSTFTIVGFKQSSYETYIEDSILNWLDSGQNVLNTSNSSFIDLIQQNLLISNGSNSWEEYYITNNYTAFTGFKVSFTQLPETDAKVLGNFANDYWLTITAMSNKTINFTSLNSSTSSSSNSSTTNTNYVSSGTTFTWVLPYALNTISLNNNKTQLQMLVNSNYSNFTNNENLPVPFGLSIDITSQTNEWLSNKTIAFDFASTNNHYELPTTWAVQFNKYADAVNLLDYDLINNVANCAGTNKSTYSFLVWISDAYLFGWAQPTPTMFGHWYVSWPAKNPSTGYSYLQIQCISNTTFWFDGSSSEGSGSTDAGTCFTLWLPFNKNGLFITNNNQIIINQLSTSVINNIGSLCVDIGPSIQNPFAWNWYDPIDLVNNKTPAIPVFKFNSSISWSDYSSSSNKN